MPAQHCSVCGKTLPEAAATAATAGKTPGSTICAVCEGKLAPNGRGREFRTNRTTILKPVASERITGKPLAPDGLAAADDDSLVIPVGTVKSPSGRMDWSGEQAAAQAEAAAADEAPVPVMRRFGSYEILGEISRGAFGVVYRARQEGLDRVVALKVLLAGPHASEEAVARFQREAKATARLKHPSIVPIYDIGTVEGHHYFAMELVDGHALSELVEKKALTIQRSLEIAEALADALECAHQASIIHRDIKPSNILVDARGHPHITDFGLAKQVDLDNKYTLSGTTLGTPAYMPPEQARGEVDKIDARSDVYAIGSVLYEMLTGQTPFTGRSLLEVVVAVINEPPQPPRQLNPRIHRDVQTIVMKCLEKNPALRYATAAELRDDIARFRSGEAIRAKPAGVLRLALRSVKRHSMTMGGVLAAVSAAILAVVFLYVVPKAQQDQLRAQKAEAARRQAVKELKQAEKAKQSTWLPYWWFPAKDAKALSAEQKKQYVVEEGKEGLFQSMVRGRDVPDLQFHRPKGKDGAEAPEKVGRLPGAETLVSPEDKRFLDVDADVVFTIKEWDGEKKLRAGLQSLAKGYDGIPYVFEAGGGSVRIVGPADLYAHTSVPESDRKGHQPLKLEVKAEKDAAALSPGRYTLKIHREGMLLSFRLTGPQSFPVATIEIKDLNLSNWVFKNTQLVVRQLPAGVQVEAAEVRRRYGGEEADAFRHFGEGEYNSAEAELKTIAERGENRLLRARALYQLGLLQEICQPTSGREIGLYTDALTQLERPQVAEAQARERVQLEAELRFRRVVYFARRRSWNAVCDELLRNRGADGKIGEPLAWELHHAIELALQEPARDAAGKEPPERTAAVRAALTLFQHLGLPPGSARLGREAAQLGAVLAAEKRFDDLTALYEAYPARTMTKVFYEAVTRALEAEQLETAIAMFNKMNGRSESDVTLRERAVCDILRAALKAHKHATVAALYTELPTLPVLKILCKEIELNAKNLAGDEFFGFTGKVLPAINAHLPADPGAPKALNDALEKVAAEIIASGRVSKLVKLHEALRKPGTMDPRLARAFAEAVTRLAAAPGTDVVKQAEALLTYCTRAVAVNDQELQRAAVTFAQRRAAVDDARTYPVIMTLQRAYAAPELLSLCSKVMLEMRKQNRYEEMVLFYAQARLEFGAGARELTPLAIAALENVTSSEQRSQLLATLWFTVHGKLVERDLTRDAQQWQLEYGDVELALNHWDKARERYQALCNGDETEMELRARAALRLAVLQHARPGTRSVAELLLPVLAIAGMPDEYEIAARLIGFPERLRLEDLDAQLKEARAPLRLTDAEWDLMRGVRLRLDGRMTEAREALAAAAVKADPSRAWVSSVASQLLRNNTRSPDEDKVDAERPAPTPPAPSANFPRVTPGPASMERK